MLCDEGLEIVLRNVEVAVLEKGFTKLVRRLGIFVRTLAKSYRCRKIASAT